MTTLGFGAWPEWTLTTATALNSVHSMKSSEATPGEEQPAFSRWLIGGLFLLVLGISALTGGGLYPGGLTSLLFGLPMSLWSLTSPPGSFLIVRCATS